MHQDAFGTGFFLTLVSGRKLFRVIRAEDAVFFAEHDVGSGDGVFKPLEETQTTRSAYADVLETPWDMWKFFQIQVTKTGAEDASSSSSPSSAPSGADGETTYENFDILGPSENWRKLSSKLTMYETVLEPGDIIYIPRWGLHGAINLLDETVSVSANYFHMTHFAMYKEQCAWALGGGDKRRYVSGWAMCTMKIRTAKPCT